MTVPTFSISVEIKADRVAADLAAFRLEVVRGYVTMEHLRRLDDRMDQGFAASGTCSSRR